MSEAVTTQTGENRLGVSETFEYQFQRAVLPFAVVGTAISSPVVWMTYEGNAGILSAYLAVFSVVLFCLYRYALTGITRTEEIDTSAFVLFVGAIVGHWIGATVSMTDSVVSCGMILVLGSFAFASSLAYFVFVVIAIVGQLVTRTLCGFEVDFAYKSFLVLGPTYAVIARVGVLKLRVAAENARGLLHHNIDELKLEKSLREETEKQLVQAQKMEGLGLLAAGVAHDFNNHLQAISSLTGLIDVGKRDADYPKLVLEVTHDAAEICRQMLAYAGRTQDVQSVFDLAGAITEMRPILNAGVPKHIELEFDISREPLFVLANRTSLQQCLTNLVRNSQESLQGRSGKIVVRVNRFVTREEGGWSVFGDLERDAQFVRGQRDAVVIEVADNGCGMDSSTMQCAFDPYFTTKESGHGFGLATTLGIVRSLSGVIHCFSRVDSGTRIQILLRASSEREVDSHEPVDDDPPQRELKRILLVEDEEMVRQATGRLLEHVGFDVDSAASADEAMEFIRCCDRPYDVFLLDYSMPHVNGMHLLEMIRAEGNQTLTVLYSGYAEESIEQRHGIRPDAFLTKPIRIDELTRVFDSLQSSGGGEVRSANV
ncbi:MAG: response regulator [Planctomycetota bacterium]